MSDIPIRTTRRDRVVAFRRSRVDVSLVGAGCRSASGLRVAAIDRARLRDA
ncbi:hypothetical protein ACNOYE_02050 [Nannocystaceae bacterium ST9]